MKKSLLYTIVGSACLLTTTSLTLIANGIESNNTDNTTPTSLIAGETTPINTQAKSFDTNESVFVITDHAGANTKSFIGSTINNSDEPIPVDLHITYTLDGTAISAENLVGKSGHVKITYDYTATKTYNGKQIPFVTVTSLSLNPDKFTNIKTTNGKIINESEDAILLAGYAIAGLNEDLGVDLLPSTFSFEADVDNFELSTAYTFATNDILADLDTSKLNSIDDLINQLNQLSSSFDQIITGSSSLSTGLDSAFSGTKELQSGASQLASGLSTLANGATTLNDGATALASGASQLADGSGELTNGVSTLAGGLNTLSSNSANLNQGATAVFNNLIGSVNTTIENNPTLQYLINTYHIPFPITIANYNSSLTTLITYVSAGGGDPAPLETAKASLDNYNTFYTGVLKYTGNLDYIAGESSKLVTGATTLNAGLNELGTGANSLATGTSELLSGANTLATGATKLSLGVNSLTSGLEALSAGGHTLANGLITFKEQGINKLVSFANHDLANLTNNLRSTVSAARSYHYYSSPSAKSVKFLFKTPSIK
ncbi:hypothetical protein IKE82_00940 [Candidatus Saccharibacteria bacterium]|nr:hypothetical protein [Candidatus Saccharibacteria bacterium]